MELGEIILSACKSRGISLAGAAKAAGLRYSTLHSQIHNGREIPFSTIDRLASALNLPVGYFSQRETPLKFEPVSAADAVLAGTAEALSDLVEKQVATLADPNEKISIDSVLDWLTSHNNRLVNCDWLIDRINLYERAKSGDKLPKPFRIGAKSLSARYFRILEVDTYKEVMDCYDEATRKEIINAHLESAKRQYLIMDRKIDTVSEGIRVKGTYRRLLAPVTDEDGRELTLAFSKLTHFSGA